MPEAQQRQLAAIMFTDMVGYTALMGKDEQKALQLLHKNRDFLKPLIQSHRGEWLKEMGDGTLSSFASAVEAVGCALEIQRTLRDDPELSLRIAIHIGDVVFEEGDVFGDGVNVASRIEPLAAPGGICISERVYDDIRNKPEIETVLLGEKNLKGVDRPIKVYALTGEGLATPLTQATAAGDGGPQPKARGRAYGVAGGFVVGTILAVLAYVVFFGGPAQADIRIPTAVVDFVNETGEPELDGLSGMLITALEQSRRLSVLTRSRMFDILKQMGRDDVDRIDEALGREIATRAELHALVVASIRKLGQRYTVDLKILDPQRDEYLFTAAEEGEGQESIFGMIDRLAAKTRRGLKEKAAEIEAASQNVADVTTLNLEAYQHYFKGEELINKLRFQEAIEEFEQAIALDSTFGLAYYRQAYAVDWELNEKRAKELIEKALSLINRIPKKEGYLVRAVYENIEKGFSEGLAVLKEMEQIYPHDKEMIYNIGDWSFHVGQFEDAAKYLEHALTLDPTHQRALQHLVLVYGSMDRYDDTLDAAHRFVSVSNDSAAYYELVGSAFLDHFEDQHNAITNLKRSLDLEPDNYDAMLTLGRAYYGLQDYDQAIFNLNRAIEINPGTISGHMFLGFVYGHGAKEPERAITQFNQALEIDPTKHSAIFQLGAMYYHLKEYDRAILSFTEYLEHRPDAVQSRNFLGSIYLIQGKFAAADKHLRDALALDSTEVTAHRLLGYLSAEQCHFDEAKDLAEESLALDSSFANYNLLAWVLIAGDIDIQRGILLAQHAIESKPGNFKWLISVDPFMAIPSYSLGLAHLKNVRYPEAVKYLQQANKLLPNREAIRDDLERARKMLREKSKS